LGPLEGIRIIEMASMGPAPFCAMVLADLGADVIRIDRLETAGQGGASDVLNRSRRSIAMDLKHPASLALVLRLIERTDALIEGYRPGVMERLGLGPEVCLARNPRLVFGRMTGWGQSGPLAQRAGHDINFIATSGVLHAIGTAQGNPLPPLNLVGDFGGGGMLLAVGILSAILCARSRGKGQVLDVAMSDGATLLSAMLHGLLHDKKWSLERGANILDGAAPFYRTYRCQDGRYIAVGALEPQFYRAFIKALGLDAEFLSRQWERGSWRSDAQAIAEVCLRRSRDEWTQRFAEFDACVSPVLDFSEAPWHAQHVVRETFTSAGGCVQPAPAPRFSATPTAPVRAAGAAGTDTRGILEDLGLSVAECDALIQAKAVGVVP
jgi:alpha-methylacyl-CoA racemase